MQNVEDKVEVIEQKGMTFNNDFSIHSPCLLSPFLGGKRKLEKNN